ncbi:probable histone-arginine methyltransferase 1.3 [Cyclospora cayetanensis]|uniref:type I protein arginine methyltransferase n=1 Tax=Cyclospora cayetanensis TaxID=88456 RepID=A0A6P6RWC7_9EIME|nr:probable histone-arginine methyltransferase 1.3 [Cyclospora cayetanensis]
MVAASVDAAPLSPPRSPHCVAGGQPTPSEPVESWRNSSKGSRGCNPFAPLYVLPGRWFPCRTASSSRAVPALEPRAVDAKKAEAPFQIPLHRLTVHRASSRLLLCADANGGAGGAQHEGKDEALSEIEGGASETVDTLFGLEFESNESQTSFLSALKSLRQQQSGLSKGGAAGRGGHLHKMEGASVSSYFGYYARHSTQRDMLRDPTRTAAYKAAITQNCRDFRNKKVLDVGAGSGILSFFAAMQGAHKVYAVEASEMAATARLLASGNPSFGSLVEVLQQPVETVELQQLGGERVDVLVSEPLGTFLFNERMIESYLYARDHLLKPGGLMFPRRSRLFCAPFSDASLFAEVSCRGSFWENQNFYGVDLRGAVSAATDEAFRQPIVDYVDPRSLVATPQCTEYDFATLHPTDLHDVSAAWPAASINLKFSFEVTTPSVLHGVATWFTVEFEGSDFCVGFTTGPDGPPTHWFQLRLLMRPPLAVNAGQTVDVHLRMLATPQQSYKISGRMSLVGTEFSSTCAEVDLKRQEVCRKKSACVSPHFAMPLTLSLPSHGPERGGFCLFVRPSAAQLVMAPDKSTNTQGAYSPVKACFPDRQGTRYSDSLSSSFDLPTSEQREPQEKQLKLVCL